MRALVLLAVVGVSSTPSWGTWAPMEIEVAVRDWRAYCAPSRPTPGTYAAVRMIYAYPTCEFKEY